VLVRLLVALPLIVVSVAVTSVSISARAQVTARAANSCASYIVIDSRGSGETTTLSKPGAVFYPYFKAYARRRDPSARVAVIPNGYPAWGSVPTMISALLKLPQQYHKSVVAGKKWLSTQLGVLFSKCPSSKIVLTGYSQGAQVTGDVYQRTSSKQIMGVVLFGDPRFNSADSADRGGVSGLDGALGTRPLFKDAPGKQSIGHVLSYCHNRDPVCQGVSRLRYGPTYHENYGATDEPEQAARYIARFVPRRSPSPGLWDGVRHFRVRPPEIVVSCADDGQYRLRWKSWSATRAVGAGTTAPCRGQGGLVSVIASQVVKHEFTRLQVSFPGSADLRPRVLILAVHPGIPTPQWVLEDWVHNPDSGLHPWP
jgi:hypothetical protein